MLERENTDLKEQIHQLQQIINELNHHPGGGGQIEVAKDTMISPALTVKAALRGFDDINLSFKTINKNLDEYKEAINDYEAEETTK
jgi:hypothetical protein